MASILGFDFVCDRIYAVQLQGGAASATVVAAFAASWPAPLTQENAARLGAWLKTELGDKGLKGSEAACCLGRGLASFKTIYVPDCPNDELASIVRFSLEGEATVTAETIIDFQAGPVHDGQREVTAALAAKSTIDVLTTVFRAAGLVCKRIAFRPYSMRFLRERILGGDLHKQELLLAPTSDGMEISVWTGAQLELTRNLQNYSSADVQTRLTAEVRRTLGAFHSKGGKGNATGLAVLAADATTIVDALRSLVGPSISAGNLAAKVAGAEKAEPGAVGVAWRALADVRSPINFLDPKKPPPRSNASRRLAVLAGALALMLVITGFWFQRRTAASLDEEIADARDEIKQLDVQLTAGKPTLARYSEVKKWMAGQIDWLNEMTLLVERLPETDVAFLTSLALTHDNKENNIKVHLRARNPGTVRYLLEEMNVDTRLKVTPTLQKFNEDVGDFGEQLDFEIAFEAPPDPPSAGYASYIRPLPPGKIRAPLPLAFKKAAVVETKPAPTKPGPVVGVVAAATPPAATTPAADGDGEAEAEKLLVERIKKLLAMSHEEREAEIMKSPSFVQRRLRNRLEEAAKAK